MSAGFAWADGEFDRYQVILDRKPFGEPPPVHVQAPPVDNTPPWAETYRLCSVYEDSNDRVQVALLDIKTKKPVMLTLGGGSIEGIELLSANVNDEQATLEKNGEAITMKLEASKSPPQKQPSKAGKKKPQSAGQQTGKARRPRGVVRSGRR